MPPPDLPAELWLEILSYFSPAFVMNLIGVNRLFFELALDYKYQELQLLTCSKSALNSFQQLSHENISRRVRSLLLRPDFLPPPEDDHEDGVSQSNVEEDKARALVPQWLRRKLERVSYLSAGRRGDVVDPAKETLRVAMKNLAKCSNLREVKIAISDFTITPTFSKFLSTLWDTVGSSLDKLCVQTTHRSVPVLLQSVCNHRERLSNLSSFELTMMHSRRPTTTQAVAQTTSAIAQFFASFQGSLSSFTLFSFIIYDLTPLFDRLAENLELKLEKLELHFVICRATLSHPSSLARFLTAQKDTLEHLVLDPRPRRSSEFFFPYSNQLDQFLLTEFTAEVVLPNVKTFQVGHSAVVPPTLVSSIMPNLVNLVLGGDGHNNGLFMGQLDAILTATAGQLTSLEAYVHEFAEETLDLLARSAPNLRRLTLSCVMYDVRFVYRPGVDWAWKKRYEGWKLEYVRVGLKGNCGLLHPVMSMMNTVAQTVQSPTRNVEKDRESRCLCTRSYYD